MRRKNPINKNAMHKLWAWSLLAINILNSSIVYAVHTDQVIMVLRGGVIATICLFFGLNKIDRDIVIKDLSDVSVWISYICTLSISLIIIYFMYDVTSTNAMIYMISVVLLECILAFFISCKR